ncbi:hypothetical protein IJU97_01730 [bacterium]|nr:hypothetical protein [bacterium]
MTNNYLVQKSPYGSIASSTPLANYKQINGDPLFSGNNEAKGANYDVPASLKDTFQKFIKKYLNASQVVKETAACGKIRKVQGKSIYFIDKSGSITLNDCISETDKPFTLVSTAGANIIIKGSLYTNAMVMTT